MNDSWAYHAYDNEWKTPQVVYEKLRDINEKGGNLLLNVGPDGKGIVQPEAIEILLATAKLLKEKPIVKRTPIITERPGIK